MSDNKSDTGTPQIEVKVGDSLIKSIVGGKVEFDMTPAQAVAYANLLLEAAEHPELHVSTDQIPT
jgi:hypothetical protein